MRFKNVFYLYASFIIVFFLQAMPVAAQTPSVTLTPTAAPVDEGKLKDLQNKIKEYEGKITELQGTKKTLSSQISIMNTQINLSEAKMTNTQAKIVDLGEDIGVTKTKIGTLDENIGNSSEVLVERIRSSYKAGRVSSWNIFASAHSVGNFFTKLKYVRLVQIADKKTIYAAEQAKNDYAKQQALLQEKQKEEESLRQTLGAYTEKVQEDKKAKQSLLGATQNDESKYQKLLQDAKSQISAFKSFSSSMSGGSVSILPAQASPDGWYYNQRDERWGKNRIGNSSEQIWDVGCLLTSAAMVMKQKGVNITPAEVAASSSYFFSDTAYFLIPWAGGKFQSVWQRDLGAIDSRLANNDPVIVGVRAGPYGQHFIVLKSGSNGDYIMNDPWEGANLKFTDFYSTSQIFQYGYYKG